ncbi:MAG: DUF559 domain-containing protein [Actinobacteria bacterium]|nr:DUF559 domain-containing protein [Actinomycetota bacterium]
MRSNDHDIIRLAHAQHGVFSTDQLPGIEGSKLRDRVASGRWIRQGDRVYSIAGSPDTWHQRLWIRLLNAGPGSVVGRCAASRLYRLRWFPDERLDIVQPECTVTRAKPRTSRRTSSLPPAHCTVHEGFPITTIERTLFDLAGLTSYRRAQRGWIYVPPPTVERIIDDALAAGKASLSRLAAVFADLSGRGRPGTTLMRSLLMERAEGFVPTESELESRFVSLIRRYGLPEPRRQVVVGDGDGPVGRVDFLFDDAHLIVELDGYRFHAQRQVRHADLQRDLRLGAAGWRTVRLDWWQVVEDGPAVAARLRTLLAV